MADEGVSQETGRVFESDESRAAWLETLPEGVRSWQEAQTAKSTGAFWEQLTNQRSQLGRSLTLPGDDATPEELSQFWAKATERANGRIAPVPDPDATPEQIAAYRRAIGVPEDVEGYRFPSDVEGLPPDAVTPERAQALRELAQAQGLTEKQFETLARGMLELDAGRYKAASEQTQALQGELKQEWGDAYDQRYQQLATFLERDGAPPAVLDLVRNKQLPPGEAKWLYGLLDRMGGEAAELAKQTGGTPIDTAEELKEQVNRMMAGEGTWGKAYWDPSNPQHDEAMKRMVDLRMRADRTLSKTLPRAGF